MIVVAVVAVLLIVVPRGVGLHRGVNVGRTAIRSHRESVELGRRVRTWEIVGWVLLVLVAGAVLR